MALSLILNEAKLTAKGIDTKVAVTLERVADGFAITAIHLTVRAKIPAPKASFGKLTAKAKSGCSVSKMLKAKIGLDANSSRLISARCASVESRAGVPLEAHGRSSGDSMSKPLPSGVRLPAPLNCKRVNRPMLSNNLDLKIYENGLLTDKATGHIVVA